MSYNNKPSSFLGVIQNNLKALESFFKGSPSQQAKEKLAANVDHHLFSFDGLNLTKSKIIMNELELALELSAYLKKESHNDYTRYRIFDVIFSMSRQSQRDNRLAVLCKLVSLSISMENQPVLECAALWMKTTEKEHAIFLVNSVIEDFCMLKRNGAKELKALMNVSQRFCCAFITAVTYHYNMLLSKQELDKLLVNKKNQTATSSTQQQEISNRWPSLKLLEIIQTMVSEEPAVCVATIIKMDKLWRTVLKQQQQDSLPLTPHVYLADWCVKSPLVIEKFLGSAASDQRQEYQKISEKLQHAFLLSLLSSKSALKSLPVRGAHGSESLWNPDQLHDLVGSLMSLCEEHKSRVKVAEEEEIVEMKEEGELLDEPVTLSVDRFAQIVQIALQMKIIPISAEQFESLVGILPMTDLLKMVTYGSASRSDPEPMAEEPPACEYMQVD